MILFFMEIVIWILEITKFCLYLHSNYADMVKLVDMPDLGSGAARRVGSSPIIRTKKLLNREAFFGFIKNFYC